MAWRTRRKTAPDLRRVNGIGGAAEVLVRWLYDKISERIQADGTVRSPTGATYEIPEELRLERVRVWETSTSWAEYVGIE